MAFQLSEELKAVEQDLLANPSTFDFFQAYRVLSDVTRLEKLADRKSDAGISVRPALSLAYSESDIDSVVKLPKGSGYQIITHISGLYGLSSPLPDFYNEELLHNDWEGNHADREFLDIIHANLLPKLYEAWSLFKLNLNVIEHDRNSYWDILYGLSGFIDTDSDSDLSRLKLNYAGLYAKHERCAEGLRMIVQDFLGFGSVWIEEFVPRYVPIPQQLRCKLGVSSNRLGDDAHVGDKIRDQNGMIRIHVDDVSEVAFNQFQSNSDATRHLRLLISSYLRQPLAVEMLYSVHTTHPEMRIGAQWHSLGVDSVMSDANTVRSISVAVC